MKYEENILMLHLTESLSESSDQENFQLIFLCDLNPIQKFRTLWQTLGKNNPKNSGHYIALQHPRAAYTLCSDQNTNLCWSLTWCLRRGKRKSIPQEGTLCRTVLCLSLAIFTFIIWNNTIRTIWTVITWQIIPILLSQIVHSLSESKAFSRLWNNI